MKKNKVVATTILVVLFIILLIYIVRLDSNNTIEIFYQGNNSDSVNGKTAELYIDRGNGYEFIDDTYVSGIINKRHVALKIPSGFDSANMVRLDVSSDEDEIKVKKIVVRSGIFTIKTIDPVILAEKTFFGNTENIGIQDGALVIKPQVGGTECYFGQELVAELQLCVERYSSMSQYVLIAILVLITVSLGVGICFGNFLKWAAVDKFYAFGCLMVIAAGILVFVMAAFSVTYGHPDEDVSAAAIDYYLKYSNLPDFSVREALDSFSNYGFTRLAESTVYYFLAGKFGWLLKNVFHVFAYFRGFNVFLFWLICWMYIKYGRKCPWMLFGILFTPQLWYVFSYATSDAWDYFLAYTGVFLVLYEESGFNKALKSKGVIQYWSYLLLEGAILGLLFLGKQNYYMIFLLIFVILLKFLIFEEENNKKNILIKYGIVFLTFLGIVLLRKEVDYITYDGMKGHYLQEIQNNVVSEQDKTIIAVNENLREQGISVPYLLNEYGFFELTFKSFCGYYGWMEYKGSYLYYQIVFSVYVCLMLSQLKFLFEKKDRNLWMCFAMGNLLNILVFGASVYHSWTSDFQPQGRYLLPGLFCLMWVVSLLSEKKILKKQIAYFGVLVVASVFSFLSVGMQNLFIY